MKKYHIRYVAIEGMQPDTGNPKVWRAFEPFTNMRMTYALGAWDMLCSKSYVTAYDYQLLEDARCIASCCGGLYSPLKIKGLRR